MHFCILRPAVNKILIGVLFASIDSLLYLRGCEGPCKHYLGILMWILFRKKRENFLKHVAPMSNPFSPTCGQHIPTSIQVSEKVYLANISSAKHCWIMLEMMMIGVIMVMMIGMIMVMMMEVIMVMMMGINGKAAPASHSSTKRSFSGKKLITNTFRGDHHYTLASQKSIWFNRHDRHRKWGGNNFELFWCFSFNFAILAPALAFSLIFLFSGKLHQLGICVFQLPLGCPQ